MLMSYLSEIGYKDTLIQLELETGNSLEKYNEELLKLRSLILRGKFKGVQDYLEIMYPQHVTLLKKDIMKQVFLEKLQNSKRHGDKNTDDLYIAIQKFENEGFNEIYLELCDLLALKNINDHENYQNWSILKGRQALFEDCLLNMGIMGDESEQLTKEIYFRNFERFLIVGKQEGIFEERGLDKLRERMVNSDQSNNIVKFVGDDGEEEEEEQCKLQDNGVGLSHISKTTDFGQTQQLPQQSQSQNEYELQPPQIVCPQFDTVKHNLEEAEDDSHYITSQIKINESFKNGETSDSGSNREEEEEINTEDDEEQEQEVEDEIDNKSDMNKYTYGVRKEIAKTPKNNFTLGISFPEPTDLLEDTRSDMGTIQNSKDLLCQINAQLEDGSTNLMNLDTFGQSPLTSQLQNDHTSVPVSQNQSMQNTQTLNQSELSKEFIEEQEDVEDYHLHNSDIDESQNSTLKDSNYQEIDKNQITTSGGTISENGSKFPTFSNSGSSFPAITFYSLKVPKFKLVCEGLDELPVRAVTFSPQGSYLGVGTNSKILQIMDASKLNNEDEEANQPQKKQSPTILTTKEFHQGPIYSLTFDQTETMVATGSMDKTCCILKLGPPNSGSTRPKISQVVKLEGHIGMVRSVDFDGSSTQLVSGGYDSEIRLWDIEYGKQTQSLFSQNSRVRLLVYLDTNIINRHTAQSF